ncbi:MAG TPA: type II 3-dehydroquinate dehydratase [Synergistaceae bacterium]|nr:type II 3-dehydroquinate dehydratase [Synergistaceae bacterium]HPJ26568.1 type II 3-dehydroquinate dehydratase [Synergistaceae bacterium]
MKGKTYAVLNGPNLNLLGEREPGIYGTRTLEELEAACQAWSEERGIRLLWMQSNSEGILLDFLQKHRLLLSGAVINAGAYSHTSYALRDCIAAMTFPVIELHLSNTAAREDFRRTSCIASVVRGRIEGLGGAGYLVALEALERIL